MEKKPQIWMHVARGIRRAWREERKEIKLQSVIKLQSEKQTKKSKFSLSRLSVGESDSIK